MLRLRMLQANEGDCLIVMHDGGGVSTRVLIDGGTRAIYQSHLRPALVEIAARGGALDLAVLTHVDSDHVGGLNELFSELRDAREDDESEVISIGELWHNAFSETDDHAGTVTPRLRSLAGVSGLSAAQSLASIDEGSTLRGLAIDLKIPLNAKTKHRPMLVDRPKGPVAVGGLSITVVGPTEKNLDALRAEWEKWFDALDAAPAGLTAALDAKKPNLSSMQLLVEGDGRRMLLTGDGRGDHLLDALESLGLLDADGRIEVDLLKLPHHGSNRNVTADFFDRVVAKTYAVSADGRYGNPDASTLEMLLASARAADRDFTLVCTNRPDVVDRFERAHPPEENRYRLIVRDDAAHYVDITL